MEGSDLGKPVMMTDSESQVHKHSELLLKMLQHNVVLLPQSYKKKCRLNLHHLQNRLLDLSETLREELKTPLGELIKDSNSDKEQIIKKIYSEKIVVTVGDATSELLIKMGLIPFLQIVDGKEKRHERDLPTSDSVVTTMNCRNPAGEITEQSIDIIKKSLDSKPPIRIIVDGEEDLLVIPVCLLHLRTVLSCMVNQMRV